MHARELSALKPQFDANNIQLVGIGLEELGLQEFVAGKFFDGDLYLDTKKSIYKQMGYKRISFFGGVGVILGKKGREALNKAKHQGISGNLKGDGFQNGGLLIIKPGGQVLLNYKQDSPTEMVALDSVLKALDISSEGLAASSQPDVPAGCNEGACARK